MNPSLVRWLVPLTLGAAACVEADSIYVVSAPGRTPLYTNRSSASRQGGAILPRVIVRAVGTKRGAHMKLFLDRYRDEISAAARAHNVDSDLVTAVIHAESSFNPRAVSPRGAQGLMQLMPHHGGPTGSADLFEPEKNIQIGVSLLARLAKKYGGNERMALAAYNAGEGAVKRHNGVPPYPETQAYVEKVLKLRTAYSLKRSRA